MVFFHVPYTQRTYGHHNSNQTLTLYHQDPVRPGGGRLFRDLSRHGVPAERPPGVGETQPGPGDAVCFLQGIGREYCPGQQEISRPEAPDQRAAGQHERIRAA